MMEEAGEKLKKIRQKLRLSFRDVEEASGAIATRHSSEEFLLALSRLSDIENKGVTPSVYRIYSLSAIYRLDMVQVMSWYGVDLAGLPADADVLQLKQTHNIAIRVEESATVQAPFALDPGIDLTRTQFLSRMIQKWGKLPLLLVQNLDLRDYRYGMTGTEDWSMHPLIPPGSLLVIDDAKTEVGNSGWVTLEDRPIYFLETRDSYLCGWCNLRDSRLTVQFHPSSFAESQSFRHPQDVEVLGQVIRVSMSLNETDRRLERD